MRSLHLYLILAHNENDVWPISKEYDEKHKNGSFQRLKTSPQHSVNKEQIFFLISRNTRNIYHSHYENWKKRTCDKAPKYKNYGDATDKWQAFH